MLDFYGISTFYGKNAEAFKLLGIAPEFICFCQSGIDVDHGVSYVCGAPALKFHLRFRSHA